MSDSSCCRRSFLRTLCQIPILLALPPALAHAARTRVLGLRHWPEPEQTRLVFDVDAAARIIVQAEGSDLAALVVDNAELTRSLNRGFPQDPLLRELRATQLGNTVEIRLLLLRPCNVEAFTLPPEGGRGHRLVVDLSPRLTQAEQAARSARHAARIDALRRSGEIVVAIDPGHGGEDPGTIWGDTLREKDVALQVAQHLERQLEPVAGVRGVLTRTADYFVPLGRRQRIARDFGASVFVSIHVNSAPSSAASGAEIFFLSLQDAVDKGARELIDRENAADLVGGVAPAQVHEPIVDILVGMTRNNTMRESERLAEVLLQRLGQHTGVTRGIKQGPLAVLKSIDKPSVLVELGFITNAGDRRLLADARARSAFAERMASGIVEYLGV
jgi:N-acetylmuramoyl-L-alanine amidase